MIVNLVFFVIISSGSVWCAWKYNKKYEVTLPITCMSMVLALFLFGLFGKLKAGVFLLIIAGVGLYFLTAVQIFCCRKEMKNRLKDFLKNIMTPGLAVFIGIFVVLSMLNAGRMACNWDEFSHWIDIVKVMTILDDFGTNPSSHSSFQSYPPAMSLFQYLLQKIYQGKNPGAEFNEWRCYFSYQIFYFAIILPFFEKMTFKKPMYIMVGLMVIVCSPLIFFGGFYNSAYIDPFLSVLSGSGLAIIVLCDKKDIFYSLYIDLLCMILILSKDAGIIFAIVLITAYMADAFLTQDKLCLGYKLFEGAIVIFLPKILWKIKLSLTNARIRFQTHIDFQILFQVLVGKDTTYRTDVLKNYIYAVFEQSIEIGYTGIKLNYISILIFQTVCLYCLLKVLICLKKVSNQRAYVIFTLAVLQMIIYLVGLCIIYMFNFDEYEAVRLASFSRYLNILLLSIWFLLVLLALYIAGNISQQYYRMSLLLLVCAVWIFVPSRNIVDLITRKGVMDSREMRIAYDDIARKIMNVGDKDSTVLVISQETSGFDKLVIRFCVRPIVVDGEWSIGETFYDGDIWTVPMNADTWREELKNGYDFVAIYKVNEYFYNHFSEVFSNPDDIMENEIYRVDKNTGILYKCQ